MEKRIIRKNKIHFKDLELALKVKVTCEKTMKRYIDQNQDKSFDMDLYVAQGDYVLLVKIYEKTYPVL